jgi:endonuclease/exonuclease/phosphatase family metal-dependent hydrolase
LSNLKIVTLNILNDLSRWPERRTVLTEQLAKLQPDLIALQEVSLPSNNAKWLAQQLGGYQAHICPHANHKGQREGLAILSRLPVNKTSSLNLLAQNRVAQAVDCKLFDNRSLVLINVHLFWKPGEALERDKQVQMILNWRTSFPSNAAIVICGDFNGLPNSNALKLISTQLASAYAAAHQTEPDYTCPTPLVNSRPSSMRDVSRGLRQLLVKIIFNRSFKAWHGTLDYIFTNERVKVIDCDVVLNRPAPHDATLYPSDHFGLAATLDLQ